MFSIAGIVTAFVSNGNAIQIPIENAAADSL